MRMVRHTIACAVAACIAGLGCATANAQQAAAPACAPYKTVVENLAKSYHERPVARAIGGEGHALMVIFASPHGATWTAVSVRAKDGLTCIVAAGTDWAASLPEHPEGEQSL